MSKNLTLKLNGEYFPDDNNPVVLTDYRYNATRMGNAPSISATVNYNRCLDDEWSDEVYVEFRGEKYYLRAQPNSSYDNTSIMYKHNIDLVSERIALEHTYFFDVVTEDTTNDKPASNNSRFAFSGSVDEFATRLTRSMLWSSLDYIVIVDADVVREDQFFDAQDLFISNALQQMYDVYHVPYYFVGKEIHIGYADNIIKDVFRYGVDDALISISKNTTNSDVINRITARGAERNIPYYYPNPTPKGKLKLSGPAADKYSILDQMRFGEVVDLSRSFKYSFGNAIITDSGITGMMYPDYKEASLLSLVNGDLYEEGSIKATFKAVYAGTSPISNIPLQVRCPNDIDLTRLFIRGQISVDSGAKWGLSIKKLRDKIYILNTPEPISYSDRYFYVEVFFRNSTSRGALRNEDIEIFVEPISTGANGKGWVSESHLDIRSAKTNNLQIKIDFETPSMGAGGRVLFRNEFKRVNGGVYKLEDYFSTGSVTVDGDDIGVIVMRTDNIIDCGLLNAGMYSAICTYRLPYQVSPYNLSLNSTLALHGIWLYLDDATEVNGLNDAVVAVDGYTPSSGDILIQEIDKRITVQNTLMPSIYRSTDGKEWFYNAENGKYKDENGKNVLFGIPYTRTHPREYIHTNDEIYPTIENIKNADGEYIDEIIDIAFDDNDNDEIYPVGHDKEGKYIHPYFFVKLRRFNGEHGFNLLDHAIESGAMTVSMKTGKCAACEFNIGVDEADGKSNPVQVDEYGRLVRDEEGNVICGRYPQGSAEIQPRQQDTRYAEVWIALKKDINTFGVVMPNASGNYRPTAGDRFVLLNIDLPEAYILAAEKRLEQDAIKYMAEHNEYKFSHSAKLSRIFFEGSPSIASSLTENSKVTLEYNNKQTELYVTSFSYNIREGQPLPEVDIELNNEIKVYKGAIDRVREDVKLSIDNTYKVVATESGKTSDRVSDLKFSTDRINATVTETKEKVDILEIDVPKINDRVAVNEELVNDIASDRELYVSELIKVEADKTTLDREYVNFVAALERAVDSNGRELFDSNGKALYTRAANAMYKDFQNKLNTYKNELKAVVLSSGKANITPEFTVAREEYVAAKNSLVTSISDGTKNAIPDVEYLKQAFGEASILDTHAVVLGDLVAVKDEGGDVVAGIYGGANSTLNDSGYTDSEHGPLMMFAGAENAQSASNAKFRAYSDGTIFASDGVFSGLVRHKTVYVTKSNVGELFPQNGDYRQISPTEMSAIIKFVDSPVVGEDKFESGDRFPIMLPILFDGTVYDEGHLGGSADTLRELVGAKFIVYNLTDASVSFCGYRYYESTNKFVSTPQCYSDWIVERGSMAIAECKIGLRADSTDILAPKTEVIYWDVQVGKI